MAASSLLPPVHIRETPSQSRFEFTNTRNHHSPKRHCTRPGCYLFAPTTQAERWAVFDAFDPAEVDDYGLSLTSATYGSADAAEARRSKRAMELRTRAKARIMPFDPCQRRNNAQRTRQAAAERGKEAPSTPKRYRTPSPAPEVFPETRQDMYTLASPPRTPVRTRKDSNDSDTTQVPRTPIRTPTHNVAPPSPTRTPWRPIRYSTPSP